MPHRTYEREQQKIAAENSESFVKLSAADFEETTFLRSRTDTRDSMCWKAERERERTKKFNREKKLERQKETENDSRTRKTLGNRSHSRGRFVSRRSGRAKKRTLDGDAAVVRGDHRFSTGVRRQKRRE